MNDQRKSSTGVPTTGTREPQGPYDTGSNATTGGRTSASPTTQDTTPKTAQGVRDMARETRDEIAGAAKEKVSEVKEKASEAKQVARRKAEELTDRGTRAASQRIEGYTRALRAAGDTLEDEGEGQAGTGLHGLADQLERAQDYFDRKDFQGLVGDTEGLARRNPELFLAGAYAAGILIGRFLRSSRPEPRYGGNGDALYGNAPGGRRALPPAPAYGSTVSGAGTGNRGGLGTGAAVTP